MLPRSPSPSESVTATAPYPERLRAALAARTRRRPFLLPSVNSTMVRTDRAGGSWRDVSISTSFHGTSAVRLGVVLSAGSDRFLPVFSPCRSRPVAQRRCAQLAQTLRSTQNLCTSQRARLWCSRG